MVFIATQGCCLALKSALACNGNWSLAPGSFDCIKGTTVVLVADTLAEG